MDSPTSSALVKMVVAPGPSGAPVCGHKVKMTGLFWLRYPAVMAKRDMCQRVLAGRVDLFQKTEKNESELSALCTVVLPYSSSNISMPGRVGVGGSLPFLVYVLVSVSSRILPAAKHRQNFRPRLISLGFFRW